ncbi:uncharacterized protein LOC125947161 [Dermacentor silvarum]|uniref:uncharacterized protein LOC125947161 n=1 Tax=Dermacentor silvarum TaxID=543639 RepID=UPI002100EA34|nr:uncharacterized protein LOC125947161 [Dermacentor silvarum]
MNCWLTATLVCFSCCIWHCALSCYNNQRLTICTRKRRVYQELCPGVPVWKCSYGTLRCGCVKRTSRRADGKCVKPEQCSAITASTTQLPEAPGNEKPTLDSADVEQQNTNADIIQSVGSHACPADPSQCEKICKVHGFQFGRCDAYVQYNCYCTGYTTPPPPRNEKYNKEERLLYWPYGQVTNTGELVRQLKDSYGCPNKNDDCLYECMQLGFNGSFCGHRQPHNCFCRAHVLSDIWNAKEGNLYPNQSTSVLMVSPVLCPVKVA